MSMNEKALRERETEHFLCLGLTIGMAIGGLLGAWAATSITNHRWEKMLSTNVPEDEAGGEITHERLNHFGTMRVK